MNMNEYKYKYEYEYENVKKNDFIIAKEKRLPFGTMGPTGGTHEK